MKQVVPTETDESKEVVDAVINCCQRFAKEEPDIPMPSVHDATQNPKTVEFSMNIWHVWVKVGFQ